MLLKPTLGLVYAFTKAKILDRPLIYGQTITNAIPEAQQQLTVFTGPEGCTKKGEIKTWLQNGTLTQLKTTSSPFMHTGPKRG